MRKWLRAARPIPFHFGGWQNHMKQIDETRLRDDLEYRVGFVSEFIGFGAPDIETIHRAAPFLAPVVPVLVDAVYARLSSYDATWRHFLPRQDGFTGEVNALEVENLLLDDPQIVFRKHHLATYFTRLVSAPYDAQMLGYLDMVGKIHTTRAGNPGINVPYMQLSALLGYVGDALNATILELEIAPDEKAAMVRAFGKLLWLQNDLISRHYIA